jgi:hypothetical protein
VLARAVLARALLARAGLAAVWRPVAGVRISGHVGRSPPDAPPTIAGVIPGFALFVASVAGSGCTASEGSVARIGPNAGPGHNLPRPRPVLRIIECNRLPSVTKS